VTDLSLKRSITDANSRNVLVVAAAGSNGVQNDLDSHPSYPCSYKKLPNLLCVAGTKQDDSLEASSSFGDDTVQLGAPGDSICTTTTGSSCATRAAVSLAAPHVAGVVALIRAKCECSSVDEIVERIRHGGDDALHAETRWHKRLDAGQALDGDCWTPCPP
jgi:subtilisin family serine protease